MGENAVSGNLIMCNRENLMNQAGFILGVPGSGKSQFAKQMIWPLIKFQNLRMKTCRNQPPQPLTAIDAES